MRQDKQNRLKLIRLVDTCSHFCVVTSHFAESNNGFYIGTCVCVVHIYTWNQIHDPLATLKIWQLCAFNLPTNTDTPAHGLPTAGLEPTTFRSQIPHTTSTSYIVKLTWLLGLWGCIRRMMSLSSTRSCQWLGTHTPTSQPLEAAASSIQYETFTKRVSIRIWECWIEEKILNSDLA